LRESFPVQSRCTSWMECWIVLARSWRGVVS